MESPPHNEDLVFDAPTDGGAPEESYGFYAQNERQPAQAAQIHAVHADDGYLAQNQGFNLEYDRDHQQVQQMPWRDSFEPDKKQFELASEASSPPVAASSPQRRPYAASTPDAEPQSSLSPKASRMPTAGAHPVEAGPCANCWIPMWDLAPISTFSESYERRWDGRNKTKNLRCFPMCGKNGLAGGHVQRGYCGSAADFRASLKIGCSSEGTLCAYATLAPASDSSPVTAFASHEGVSLGDLERIEGVIPCEVLPESSGSSSSVIVRVRGDRSKWNYMWLSSRQLKHVEHALNVFLFEKGASGDFIHLVGSITTPPFTLTSGRTVLRRKRQLDDGADASAKTGSASPYLSSSSGGEISVDNGASEVVADKRTRQKRASRAKLLAGFVALCRAERERCAQRRQKRAYLRHTDLINNIATPLFCETLGDEDLSSFLFGDSDELELDLGENFFEDSLEGSPLQAAADPVVPANDDAREAPLTQSPDTQAYSPPSSTQTPSVPFLEDRKALILDTVAENRKLGETLDHFFETCVSGPAGESLQAALSTSKAGVLQNDFARAVATRLYETFEESLGGVIEEVLAEHSDEIQEFEDTDVKTLEAFLLCIPAVNKKRSMLRKFENTQGDPSLAQFNGRWMRAESGDCDRGYIILSDLGLFTRPFASTMALSSRYLEIRATPTAMHIRMGDPEGPWMQQMLKEIDLDDKVRDFQPSGSLFWLGDIPPKKGRARLRSSACGRYTVYETVYLMTSDYTSAVFGGESSDDGDRTDEEESATFVAMVEMFTADKTIPDFIFSNKKLFEFPTAPSLEFEDIHKWPSHTAPVFEVETSYHRVNRASSVAM